MKTITIQGKEYQVKFSMRTVITFERQSGKKFPEIYDEYNKGNIEPLADLVDIMLGAVGAPLIEDISFAEYNHVMEVCGKAIQDFYSTAPGDSIGEQKKEGDEEEGEKNS